MRIALLSNVTVEVLAGMLKKEQSVWIPSGFGAWMETALNPPPEMREFNPEAVFLLIDASHAAFDGNACKVAKATLETAFPLATVIVPDLDDLADEVGDFYDERMTTMVAYRFLGETGTYGKKRKDAVDTLSAEIILQNYIDRERAMKGR